ncbi:MAG: 1-(5-phosphoribosyl)-5-[(5-phosphoribosylamino)methylideneamino]imidazole-4-carboxamide isomerase [Bacteroidales bacterium]|nr:1-(5-phosphoribosyl)-5-[(5-phosphoribosylamino)methylideneamino]imidazole-4-carboxamide isomerase [Bacteroidales bacterium]MBN2764253.1 1-(5-phosphoribosyl)-5-[(5-phosphoribosylamino)methylideneamino]imidazole-4-carboxamide isomerase [Bacteroidales bacterium]
MIQIIPAIDIIEGKCVRLEQGDYRMKKVYNADPLEVAQTFQDNGITRLHMVDLDGARSKHVVNWGVLERLSARTSLKIDFGGGIKTDADLHIVFESGASMATIGSIAIRDKELFNSWMFAYGPERIILGADVKEQMIAISGWQEITDIGIVPFLTEYSQHGVKEVLCTDVSKDGMLQGVSLNLYKMIREKFPAIRLLASGGITSVADIDKLDEMGVYGAVIGKAYYEGRISLKDLKKFTYQ